MPQGAQACGFPDIRLCLSLVIVGLAHAQTPVNLYGSVRDFRTEKPVAGAMVRLPGMGPDTVTDTGDGFLVATSALRKPMVREGWERSLDRRTLRPAPSRRPRIHLHPWTFPARKGRWFFRTSGGRGLDCHSPCASDRSVCCAFETPRSHRTIRFPDVGRILRHANPIGQCGSRPPSPRLPLIPPPSRSMWIPCWFRKTAPRVPPSPERLQSDRNGDSAQRHLRNRTWTTRLDPGSLVELSHAAHSAPRWEKRRFGITLQIGAIRDVGITKSAAAGSTISKEAQSPARRSTGPSSPGLDYDLALSNGSTEVEQIQRFSGPTTSRS